MGLHSVSSQTAKESPLLGEVGVQDEAIAP